ncbi:DMT family transporter [Candidatus Woesearchaeota archaeon]|nr:DMT family transporter [Candidatus Woesearchaeota archaeon]
MEWQLLSFLSAATVGFYAIATKRALSERSPLEFAAIFATGTALLSLVGASRISFAFSGWFWFLVLLKAALSYCGNLLWLTAFRKREISLLQPLENLLPLFVALFALVSLGERITTLQLAGVIVSIAGVYLLQAEGGLTDGKKTLARMSDRYVLAYLGGVAIFGMCAVVDRQGLSGVTVESWLLLTYGISAVFYIITLLARGGAKRLSATAGGSFTWAVGLALAFWFVSEWSYAAAAAIPVAAITLVISLRRFGSLVATIVGGSFFSEKGLVRKGIACLILIGAGVLIAL